MDRLRFMIFYELVYVYGTIPRVVTPHTSQYQ